MAATQPYTGADLFVDTLEEYGVDHLFGNPGTTELPIINALSKSDVEYVLGLHEDVAVGMASGYARTLRHRFSAGEDVNPVGVVNLHVTPGTAHGIGNLYGANFNGSPLVITAGDHGTDFQHEAEVLRGDLVEMTEQFTKWSAEVKHVDALPTMLRRAFRTALTPPTGPVFLGLPMNVMMGEVPKEIEPLGPIPNAGPGDATQIRRAADLLTDVEEPVIVVGDKVARSTENGVEAAVRLAEACGARVHGESATAEVNFPGDHDQFVSIFPDRERSISSLLDTDGLLLLGCSTLTTTVRHELDLIPPDATIVSVNDDPTQVGKNHPVDAAIVGDVGLVADSIAAELADRLSPDAVAERQERAVAFNERVSEKMAAIGTRGEDVPGLTKAEFVDGIQSVAGDARIVDEGVTTMGVMYVRWNFKPEKWMSNKGGGLGYGLPAAIGASLAESKRSDPETVVCIVGDGSFYYYPHALYSAARYDVDLSVVVSNNRKYRILIDNLIEVLGGTEADYSEINMDFDPPIDVSKLAEAFAVPAQRAETVDEFTDALEAAVSTSGPSLVDTAIRD